MRRALAAGLAAAILVAASYGFRTLSDDPVAPPIVAYSTAPSPQLHEVDRLIGVFEQRVETTVDALNWRELGRFYLERARLTGDVGAYGGAVGALDEALALAPGHPAAQLHLAQASLGVHRFEEALTLAERLVEDDLGNAAAMLVIADAQFELGAAEAAASALEAVGAALGEISVVQARRAQHADARGDLAAALAHAESALEMARSTADPRQIAFYLTFVAHFLNDLGRYQEAESMLREAIALAPEWPPSHATLGAVLISQGRLADALRAYTEAVELGSDPGTLAMIGDIHAALGDQASAKAWYHKVEPAATETPIHAEAYRRTIATYLADHDLEPGRALALSEADLAARNDPFGHDIYAWTLYRAGQIVEAREAIDGVFAAGLREPQMLYHSALIAIAEGNDSRARAELTEALDLAPRFHPLQALDAERLLVELGG